MAEQRREFGLELLSIVETEDINVSEARLFERHHARLGAAWLALDDYQLRELQKSDLQVYAHHSRYIRPEQRRRGMTAVNGEAQRAMDRPGRRSSMLKSDHRPSLRWHTYGASALRRNRSGQADRVEGNRLSLRETIDNALTDLWHNHPWKCLLVLALILLFLLATVDWSCSPRFGC
ncbi:MAG: hypothetical protein OXG85_12365 [Chloroflexi bacterium]|nr:hypothetical protein [Chloroflexota bacterium]